MRGGQQPGAAFLACPDPATGSKTHGVSDTPAPITPSRSLFIAGAGVLLLSIPFFAFGLGFLDTKARVEFSCQEGGPCTLVRAGWLTREAPVTFRLKQMTEARVDRRRSSREGENIYRPVLVTTQGDFPLAAHWMEKERQAQAPVISVNRFLEAGGLPAFSMWHDDRMRASRVGMLFTGTAGVVFLLGVGLTWRAVRRRGQERARGPEVSTG